MNELATTDSQLSAYIPSQYSTINPTDSETTKMVVNAMNGAVSLNDVKDAVLDIIGIVCKPGVRRSRDRNGVDTPCTDTILVAKDGKAYFTQSEGIRKAADNFFAANLFANGEVIKMHVQATALPNGNTLKTLILD